MCSSMMHRGVVSALVICGLQDVCRGRWGGGKGGRIGWGGGGGCKNESLKISMTSYGRRMYLT